MTLKSGHGVGGNFSSRSHKYTIFAIEQPYTTTKFNTVKIF